LTDPLSAKPVAYVVLPCLNEEVALTDLLPAIQDAFEPAGQPYRVVVVDDGSDDGTVAVANAWGRQGPLTVLSHEKNQGLGAAMQTGLSHVVTVATDADVVVTLDADLTHPPALALVMIARIAAGDEVVIASRYAPGGAEIGLKPHRKLMSRCASFLLQTYFHVTGARDYTCGFRAYQVGALRRAFRAWQGQLVEDNSFVCMAEILVKLGALGTRIGEVGLQLRYDLKTGPSKLRVLRTIRRYFVLIGRREQIRAVARRWRSSETEAREAPVPKQASGVADHDS
jgi:dolichol-phosphate mannosyltransferase